MYKCTQALLVRVQCVLCTTGENTHIIYNLTMTCLQKVLFLFFPVFASSVKISMGYEHTMVLQWTLNLSMLTFLNTQLFCLFTSSKFLLRSLEERTGTTIVKTKEKF